MIFIKYRVICFVLFLKRIFFKILFIYLFLERGEGKEKERERNISVWLPLTCPPPGTWPTTQACALTGNWTSDSPVRRPTLNPLSYTSQGCFVLFIITHVTIYFLKIFVFINNNVEKVLAAESLCKFCYYLMTFLELQFHIKLFHEIVHIKILFKNNIAQNILLW